MGLNDVDNFPRSLHDEELSDCVTYLYPISTLLPVDIIVDSGKSYEFYNHLPCIFVVLDNEDVVPVVISDAPRVIGHLEDNLKDDVCDFIKTNHSILLQVADMNIDGADFFDAMANYRKNKRNANTQNDRCNERKSK